MLTEFKDACDVSVLKMSSNACLIDEHLYEIFVLHNVREDTLEGKDALKPVHTKGFRFENLGHSADIDPLEEQIFSKGYRIACHDRTLDLSGRFKPRRTNDQPKPGVCPVSARPREQSAPRLSTQRRRD